MADGPERLSPDDMATWQALLAEAAGAHRALEVVSRHLARKYMLGPTRRLRDDGTIEVAGGDAPPAFKGDGP